MGYQTGTFPQLPRGSTLTTRPSTLTTRVSMLVSSSATSTSAGRDEVWTPPIRNSSVDNSATTASRGSQSRGHSAPRDGSPPAQQDPPRRNWRTRRSLPRRRDLDGCLDGSTSRHRLGRGRILAPRSAGPSQGPRRRVEHVSRGGPTASPAQGQFPSPPGEPPSQPVDGVSEASTFDVGYPVSSDADLDPGPRPADSLEDADRDAADEHRFTPEGRRPDGSIEDEERFEDADGVDDADARHQLAGGRE